MILWTKIKSTIRDKWPLILSLNICIFLLWYAYGCEPTTASLIDRNEQVTSAELTSELDFLLAKAETRFQDLYRKQKIRDLILQQSIIIAEGQPLNPVGVITSLLAIFGVGAGVDDIRLRKERKKVLTYEPLPKDDPKT